MAGPVLIWPDKFWRHFWSGRTTSAWLSISVRPDRFFSRTKFFVTGPVREQAGRSIVLYNRILHYEFNLIGFYLETAGHSLSHSYLPTINRLLIALRYHGHIYRGHSIVLNHGYVISNQNETARLPFVSLLCNDNKLNDSIVNNPPSSIPKGQRKRSAPAHHHEHDPSEPTEAPHEVWKGRGCY